MAVETHRFAFPALASDLRHTDYLIAFAGGYHAEILRFLVDTFACVLHFEFGIAFGAGTAFKGVAQYAVAVPLVTAVGAGNVPFLGAVADMFNTVAVCPNLFVSLIWGEGWLKVLPPFSVSWSSVS